MAQEDQGLRRFGQSEVLVHRIKELIEGYRDGLDVYKELIQNADDAGADEFRICFDRRKNTEWNSSLFDKKFKEVQGEAIWFYNNAKFSLTDFENLIKLGSRNKMDKTGVIGKFGLGFNAVYNITDTPSIISGDKMVIFDPSLKCFSNEWKDKYGHGVLIDLTNRNFIEKHRDQFKPYDGMFGCKIFHPEDNSFEGTLLRLPFRKSPSEISNVLYTNQRAKKILNILRGHRENILLFTQSICNLKVYLLEEDQQVNEIELVFEVDKSPVEYIQNHNIDIPIQYYTNDENKRKLIKQSSVLKFGNNFTEEVAITFIQKIQIIKPIGERYSTENEIHRQVSYWLQTAKCFPRPAAFENDIELRRHYPCTGVSIKLECINNSDGLVKYKLSTEKGVAFCFLPLNKNTNLSFHINGNFSLTSTREDIVLQTSDRLETTKFKWNDQIKSYIASTLIQAFQDMFEKIDYETADMIKIWPINVDDNFKNIETEFIKQVFDYNNQIKIFKHHGRRYSIANCKIIKLSFKDPFLSEAQNILQELEGTDNYILYLPDYVWSCLNANMINPKNIINEEEFAHIFATNITRLSRDKQMRFIKYLLEEYCFDYVRSELKNIGNIFQEKETIPTNLSSRLAKPRDLINVKSELSQLFDPSQDDVFPNAEIMNNFQQVLLRMGLIDKFLSSEMILNRIESFLNNPEGKSLDYGYKILNSYFSTLRNETRNEQALEYRERIKQIKFLTQKGRTDNSNLLYSLDELYSFKYYNLLKRIKPILDDTKLSQKNLEIFERLKDKLGVREPTINEFFEQFKEIHNDWYALPAETTTTERNRVGESIFEYFIEFMNEISKYQVDKNNNLNDLKSNLPDKFLFFKANNNYNYFSAEETASTVNYPSNSHIVKLPYEVRSKIDMNFLTSLGVQNKFSLNYLLQSLKQIYDEHNNRRLENDLKEVCINIVKEVLEELKESKRKIDDSITNVLYLPDKNNFLISCKDLCYVDESIQWLDVTEVHVINDDVPIGLAKAVQIKGLQKYYIQRFQECIAFGQEEPLKYRIKKLLESYPNFNDILKELIQNADDAGASEINFIIDARTHKTEKIFESEFAPLQGPALCVYNNKPFSREDIFALKNLGVRNKKKNQIGKYGVGFNTVYHLTNAPQILSDLKDYITFDPLCKYSSSKTPGCLIENKEETLLKYSDFIDSFMGTFADSNQLKNGTMFRFALRTESSDLTDNLFSINDVEMKIRENLDNLRNSMLFLKNIKNLKVTKIIQGNNHTMQVNQIANFCLQYENDTCQAVHKSFIDYLDRYATIKSIIDIPKQIFKYNITIDNKKFTIINQIGTNARNFGSLNVNKFDSIPLAGVAIPKPFPMVDVSSNEHPCSLFCFLPIPINSPLPFHINSNFALVNESRQGLYNMTDMKNDYKVQWNRFLFEYIISESVIEVLKEFKSDFENYSGQSLFVDETRRLLEAFENNYMKYFPNCLKIHEFIDLKLHLPDLIKGFYTILKQTSEPLIPIIKNKKLKWVSINCKTLVSSETLRNFCSSLNTRPSIHSKYTQNETTGYQMSYDEMAIQLFQCGFNLCNFLQFVKFINFNYATVEKGKNLINELSGEYVIKYFKTNMGLKLDEEIYSTVLKNENFLAALLKFCVYDITQKQEKKMKVVEDRRASYVLLSDYISVMLDGCPLMLCRDNIIRRFSNESPIYGEKNASIFINSRSLFLKESQLHLVEPFSEKNFQKSELLNLNFKCIKKVNLKDLNTLLSQTFNESRYSLDSSTIFNYLSYPKLLNHNGIISLCKTDEIDSKKLIQIWEIIVSDFDDKSVNNLIEHIKFITPISSWSLIPVSFETGTNETYLAPIGASSLIINKDSISSALPQTFLEFFKNCGLPFYDTTFLRSFYEHFKNSWTDKIDCFLKAITKSLDNVENILDLLSQINQVDSSRLKDLDSKVRSKFLNYLAQNKLITYKESSRNKFTSLPIFTNAFSEVCSFDKFESSFLIEKEVPLEGLKKVFDSKKYFVGVYDEKTLGKVYEILNIGYMSTTSFYEYFFDELNTKLDIDEKHVHMVLLKDKYSKKMLSTQVIEKFKDFRCIRKKLNETMFVINKFYDPRVNIFQVLLRDQPDVFPAAPYNNDDWYDFLVNLGLQNDSILTKTESIMMFLKMAIEKYKGKLITFDEFLTTTIELNGHLKKINAANDKFIDELKQNVLKIINLMSKNNQSNHSEVQEKYLLSLCEVLETLSSKNEKILSIVENTSFIFHEFKKSEFSTPVRRFDSIDRFVEYKLDLNDQVDDYLFIFPEYLYKYKNLFRRLGLKREVNFQLCCELLVRMHDDSLDHSTSALQTMKLLFKSASSSLNYEGELYLLNAQLKLVESTGLYYIDQHNLEYLCDCESIRPTCLVKFADYQDLNYDSWAQLINRLPERLRPKPISEFIKNEIIHQKVMVWTFDVELEKNSRLNRFGHVSKGFLITK